ncbi:MAG: HXXEE domain-containing protein [Candidatus Acidiferrales bacterium]|jgi:uncharacterized protein with HXXEE motif
MPKLQFMLWLCLAAYGIHILEEFVFDWRNWARNVLHLPTEWGDFYVANGVVVVLGVVATQLASVWPEVALGFPALMLINAAFFHLAPFVWTRGRFSPGLITATLLFFPLGISTFCAARPNQWSAVFAFLIGAAVMATPIVFLKLRTKPYFDQTD